MLDNTRDDLSEINLTRATELAPNVSRARVNRMLLQCRNIEGEGENRQKDARSTSKEVAALFMA